MRQLVLTILLVCTLHASPRHDSGNFTFSKDDLKVLEQSAAVARQYDRRGLLFHDAVLEEHLAALAQPMLPPSLPERVQWNFRVLRDPLVNVFSLPDGSIYIHTGLLALLENDDQLAGILAHEIDHVMNRHAYLTLRDYRRKQVSANLFKVAAAWMPLGVGLAAQVVASINEPLAVTTVSGYGAEFEREADKYAAEQISHGGHDPSQMVRLLQTLENSLDPEPSATFYTSHPRLEERIADLRGFSGKPAVTTTNTAYVNTVAEAIRQNISMDLQSRRYRTAVALAQRLVSAHPDDPSDLCLLAEAYRALGPRTAQLSDEERASANRSLKKQTEEEEYQSLRATTAGLTALEYNQAQAEQLLQRALRRDPAHPKPHLGLALLYEQQNRTAEALAEYREYLRLAPDAPDRARAEREIQRLDRAGKEH